MPDGGDGKRPASTTRTVIRFLAYLLGGPVLLMVAGGDTRWVEGWALVGLVLLGTIASRLVVSRLSPDLLAERGRSIDARDAAPWDKALAPLIAVALPLVASLLSGLDHRGGWSPRLPAGLTVAGGVAVGLSFLLGGWAMAANRFFSGTVRIQADRGHRTVSTGPYSVIRHPGYAGVILYTPGLPLLLGSLWALIPSAATLVLVVLRTALEDRYLQENLPGYREYAARVRYRLLPGIW